MTELDLDAIEARANAGVRQTTADTDVLALVARVRELEDEIHSWRMSTVNWQTENEKLRDRLAFIRDTVLTDRELEALRNLEDPS